jgi:ubiquinone biosynthesis protein COQ9
LETKEADMDLDDVRDRLVLAALPHAAFDGWGGVALAAAAADEGMAPTMPARAFPGGAVDAVAHFVALADRMMEADLLAVDLTGLRVPRRIQAAIRVRLERWAPHREAVRRALAVLALPPHLGSAARLTWDTADAIWRAIGDSSHDFSWYTRRSTLAAVYSATLLYWLDDGSEGAADTLAFVERRLADVGKLTRVRLRVGAMLEQIPHPGRPGRPKPKHRFTATPPRR